MFCQLNRRPSDLNISVCNLHRHFFRLVQICPIIGNTSSAIHSHHQTTSEDREERSEKRNSKSETDLRSEEKTLQTNTNQSIGQRTTGSRDQKMTDQKPNGGKRVQRTEKINRFYQSGIFFVFFCILSVDDKKRNLDRKIANKWQIKHHIF